jgi:hypothetical protein
MGNIKFEARRLVNATDRRGLLLKVHHNAFDTRTSFMYDRYPQTISFFAKDRKVKRRKQNSGIEHPKPPSEA